MDEKKRKLNIVSAARKAAFRAGDRLALWDEVFESGGRVEAAWARKALVAYALEISRSVRSRTGRGRQARAMSERQQIFDDLLVYLRVIRWRKKWWKPKRAAAKPYSWRRAFAQAARESNLSIEATRTAYLRGTKRFTKGSHTNISDLFLLTSEN
jgi:hypothetical protein